MDAAWHGTEIAFPSKNAAGKRRSTGPGSWHHAASAALEPILEKAALRDAPIAKRKRR